MLLRRADQAIFQKHARELLDSIVKRGQDHVVVMRDNRPTAVMMATERYEPLIEELEELRVKAVDQRQAK